MISETTQTPKRKRNKHHVTICNLIKFFEIPPKGFEPTFKSASEFFKVPINTLAGILSRNNLSKKDIIPECKNDELAKLSYSTSIEHVLLLNPLLSLKHLHTMRYNYRRKNGLNCFLQPCAEQSKNKKD